MTREVNTRRRPRGASPCKSAWVFLGKGRRPPARRSRRVHQSFQGMRGAQRNTQRTLPRRAAWDRGSVASDRSAWRRSAISAITAVAVVQNHLEAIGLGDNVGSTLICSDFAKGPYCLSLRQINIRPRDHPVPDLSDRRLSEVEGFPASASVQAQMQAWSHPRD